MWNDALKKLNFYVGIIGMPYCTTIFKEFIKHCTFAFTGWLPHFRACEFRRLQSSPEVHNIAGVWSTQIFYKHGSVSNKYDYHTHLLPFSAARSWGFVPKIYQTCGCFFENLVGQSSGLWQCCAKKVFCHFAVLFNWVIPRFSRCSMPMIVKIQGFESLRPKNIL